MQTGKKSQTYSKLHCFHGNLLFHLGTIHLRFSPFDMTLKSIQLMGHPLNPNKNKGDISPGSLTDVGVEGIRGSLYSDPHRRFITAVKKLSHNFSHNG